MEKMYRDFTVCEKCGGACYLGNKYCEDCANNLVADNEEIIEKLKDESVKYYCAAFNYKENLKKQDQDKISFCIEKLEKVKEYAIHIQGGLIDYIDNQIRQLKEGM